eukprot:TRINITY_DN27753_c0_g1_i1.p1 TRINITY_DN27753_c0_g1~~TRINITY_DN27753_c0_g1_i1.p1  ORF type:complete len:445 (-),score=68.39 TRINITY_DN27753_c0_g1_i1:193-1488(-)
MTSRLAKRVLGEGSGGGAAIWAEITALGRRPGMINLGQGFPDFPGSKAATEGAQEALSRGSHDQYSPIPGSVRLTEAVSKLYAKMHQRTDGNKDAPKGANGHPQVRTLDPTKEICVVSSGTEAIFTSIMGLVDPGDEVVLFEPFFPWYLPCIRMAGGVAKPVRLMPPSFSLAGVEAEVRRAFSSKTKLCIFNTPHNPTGACASVKDIELLSALCKEHDVLCLADEVYEACIFPGAQHRRICDADGMWDRTLSIGSASKLLSLTGWRVGWVSGPADLVGAAKTVHAYTTFCAPAPLQEGVAAAMEAETNALSLAFDGRAELMAENHKLLGDALIKLGVKVCPAEGGYFLVADVACTGMTDLEFCRWMATEHKVVAVPMSVFYAPNEAADGDGCHLVRFAICKQKASIEVAVKALQAATLPTSEPAAKMARTG